MQRKNWLTHDARIAYWIDYGFFFLEGSIRWRFPIAFQSFFTILVMIGLLFLPDSPRWLSMQGRIEDAREVTSRLVGKPIDDEAVTQEIREIQDALEVQSRGGGFKYRELFTNGPSQNLRRTMLGVFAQFFQQMCGINLVSSSLPARNLEGCSINLLPRSPTTPP